MAEELRRITREEIVDDRRLVRVIQARTEGFITRLQNTPWEFLSVPDQQTQVRDIVREYVTVLRQILDDTVTQRLALKSGAISDFAFRNQGIIIDPIDILRSVQESEDNRKKKFRGKTVLQRLQRIGLRLFPSLRNNVQVSLNRDVVGDFRSSFDRISIWTNRLLLSEVHRSRREVEEKVISAAGYRFFRWRLSPFHNQMMRRHKVKRPEICDVFAGLERSPTRELALQKQAKDAFNVTIPTSQLPGLYIVGQGPIEPHPFCRCYKEPAAF